MTKKDYELIAGAVAGVTTMSPPERYAITNASIALADALSTTNPRFDRDRFLRACGVN